MPQNLNRSKSVLLVQEDLRHTGLTTIFIAKFKSIKSFKIHCMKQKLNKKV